MSEDLRDATLDDLTPEQKKILEKKILEYCLKVWHDRLEPLRKAIRDSERITGEDLALRINCRDDDDV